MIPLVGRVVAWGNRKGVVVADVPAHKSLRCIQWDMGIVPRWPAKQIGGADAQCASVCDRVLVRVDRVDARGQAMRPLYFAPRVGSVEVIQ